MLGLCWIEAITKALVRVYRKYGWFFFDEARDRLSTTDSLKSISVDEQLYPLKYEHI
jgi:hypothetical protein